MKPTGLTFLMLFVGLTGICQETKLVKKKFNNSKQISESYYVLKSDGLTKHGDYVAYFMVTDKYQEDVKSGKTESDNFIREKGSYVNGKKDGDWVEYSSPQKIKTQGKYANDKKVGVWLTYKGEVIERFDYDNNTRLEPLIRVSLKYPNKARENDIQGTVKIRCEILEDCSIINATIIESVGGGCDEESMRALTRVYQLMKEHIKKCEAKTDTLEFKFNLQ